ncbi:MAG: T9SS type A sorting domain-containing protein [Saprospiraceae bacterium]|nr:T9SS type A sorting domain-containing protein [Saprospiraceae bacterium]
MGKYRLFSLQYPRLSIFPQRISNVEDDKTRNTVKQSSPRILSYPNPANSEFNISIENILEKPNNLFLSDWKGQRYPITYDYDENNNKITAQINSNILISGIYFITCITQENIISSKILINHE